MPRFRSLWFSDGALRPCLALLSPASYDPSCAGPLLPQEHIKHSRTPDTGGVDGTSLREWDARQVVKEVAHRLYSHLKLKYQVIWVDETLQLASESIGMLEAGGLCHQEDAPFFDLTRGTRVQLPPLGPKQVTDLICLQVLRCCVLCYWLHYCK